MYCEECSGDVNHQMLYLSVLLDRFGLPLTQVPFRWFGSLGHTNARYFARACTILESLGLAQLLDEPDDKTLLLDQVLWQEAQKRGVAMREFRPLGMVTNTFIATLPNGQMIDFDGVPLPHAKHWWVNNKEVMKKKFSKLGFPTARGRAVATLRGAQKLFSKLESPVIVKPAVGSASRHTTTHIVTTDELEAAFRSAKKVSPFVMIEEELVGAVYRPTLVDSKLIATLRRDQAHVVGDGEHTIEELTHEVNKHPKRQGPYFSHIQLTSAAERELASQGFTLRDIPAPGQHVQLHQKINWALGGTTADVSDEVHPDNIKLFEDVAAALTAPLVGIDFIVEDISRPWHEQRRAGIIECNDMPYFDNHHLPFSGKLRDVAGPVWDLALNSSSAS